MLSNLEKAATKLNYTRASAVTHYARSGARFAAAATS
jgi:hypothetical protein